MSKEIKNKFILWKRKDADTYNKSYVQDIVETNEGKFILELADGAWGTRYPTRVDAGSIDILTPIPQPNE